MTRSVTALVLASSILASSLEAQTLFGSSCSGASGVTPTLAVNGIVKSGSTWTLDITAPGGIGLGYLLIGFSNTSASAFGGLPLPIDLGVFFADPLWSGCSVNVDPSFAIEPYAFDPNTNGGIASFTFPGWDLVTVHMQAVNIDPDFVTHLVGVSQGLTIRRTPPVGMVSIAPGTFEMGSNATGATPYFDGQNIDLVHTVTISYPFWMGRFEVTQAEYEAAIGFNPSGIVGPNLPVERVTWHDARAYCAALTAAEALAGNVPFGYEYRLPTEAEWEYACRAGTTTEFNVGPALFCNQAKFGFSYHSNSSCNSVGTAHVGRFAPNPWGLYDMHGNVWEWCLDSSDEPYSAAPVTDPFTTGGLWRIMRGGGWGDYSSHCRSALRGHFNPGAPSVFLGFRVVLAPVLVP